MDEPPYSRVFVVCGKAAEVGPPRCHPAYSLPQRVQGVRKLGPIGASQATEPAQAACLPSA